MTSDGSRGKVATRRALRLRRDTLAPHVRAAASSEICRRALAVITAKLAQGTTVALYAAKHTEVDPSELDEAARAAGYGVVYPRVVEDGAAPLLQFHRVTLPQLELGRFGLRQPAANAPLVPTEEIAGFIVPGLAFDRAGGRIGWGHGYYDTTLTAVPTALRIGLGFDCQVIDHVPRDPHDALLHTIITEVVTLSVT